jgi:hypothetical protein
MANRVVVKPSPDIVAPSVGIAPARATSSFLGGFTGAVLPTLMGIAKSRVGTTDRNYLLELGDEFSAEVSGVEGITPEALSTIQSKYESELAQKQIELGIPRQDLESHKNLFKDITNPQKYFPDVSKDKMQQYYDGASGEWVTNISAMNAVQKASIRIRIADTIPPSELKEAQDIEDLTQRQAATEKVFEKYMDKQSKLMKTEQNVSLIKAQAEQNKWTDEVFKRKTLDNWNAFRDTGRVDAGGEILRLSERVGKNLIDSEQAKGEFGEWLITYMGNPDNLKLIQDMKRDSTEYEKVFEPYKLLSEKIFSGSDPDKKLSRETATLRYLIETKRLNIWKNLSKQRLEGIILSESLMNASVTARVVERIKEDRAEGEPGEGPDLMMYQIFNEESRDYLKKTINPLMEKAEGESPAKARKKNSNTRILIQKVSTALDEAAKGSTFGEGVVSPAYAMEIYEGLKKSRPYKYLDTESKRVLEKKFSTLQKRFDDIGVENLYQEVTGAAFSPEEIEEEGTP